MQKKETFLQKYNLAIKLLIYKYNDGYIDVIVTYLVVFIHLSRTRLKQHLYSISPSFLVFACCGTLYHAVQQYLLYLTKLGTATMGVIYAESVVAKNNK